MRRLLKLPLSARLLLLSESAVCLPTHWDGGLLLCPAPEHACEECRVRRPVRKWYVPVGLPNDPAWRMVELSELSFAAIAEAVPRPWRGQEVQVVRPNRRTPFECLALGELDRRIALPHVALGDVQEALSALYDLPTPLIGKSWSKDVAGVAKVRMDAHHCVRPQLPFAPDAWSLDGDGLEGGI